MATGPNRRSRAAVTREVMRGERVTRPLSGRIGLAPSLLVHTLPRLRRALSLLSFFPSFLGGLDVTSPKRFTLTLAAAFTLASSVPAWAQIVYPFPPYRYAQPDASVRLEVSPHDAEVYVDGYYAGIVDDFDGMLQRLRVEPGQHEITLYHDGYRAVHQRVYLTRDRTFKIKQELEKLPTGEAAEPRPVPAPLPAGVQPPVPLPRAGRGTPPNLPPASPPAGPAAPAAT